MLKADLRQFEHYLNPGLEDKFKGTVVNQAFPYLHDGSLKIRSGYKTPKNQMSNNKTPKITKSQNLQMSKLTKCPKLQNVQNYKMSKIKKCPKLQNIQSYKISKFTKCPKLQNVQMSKITKLYYFYVHLTSSITLLTRSWTLIQLSTWQF